jgi:hypothetical protein
MMTGPSPTIMAESATGKRPGIAPERGCEAEQLESNPRLTQMNTDE